MILFATSFDDQTRACHAIALRLQDLFSMPLLGENASREELIHALGAGDDALVALSHGDHSFLFGHRWEQTLSENDADILKGRHVFAFACHTATSLGNSIALEGGTWWGYTGTISAPPDEHYTKELFDPIFAYIFQTFHGVITRSTRLQLLEILKSMCDEVEQELTDRGIFDMGARLCLLHMWDRLRICPAQKHGAGTAPSSVERHPQSADPEWLV